MSAIYITLENITLEIHFLILYCSLFVLPCIVEIFLTEASMLNVLGRSEWPSCPPWMTCVELCVLWVELGRPSVFLVCSLLAVQISSFAIVGGTWYADHIDCRVGCRYEWSLDWWPLLARRCGWGTCLVVLNKWRPLSVSCVDAGVAIHPGFLKGR